MKICLPIFSTERGVKLHIHFMVKLKNSSCYRIQPGKTRKLRLAAGFEPATCLTLCDVKAYALANRAIRPGWPTRDKCLYDSQSIVSALAWKPSCKRRTQHHKIADIFQSGAKWQKTNVFRIENTLGIILIHNRMVMSGDVFFRD